MENLKDFAKMMNLVTLKDGPAKGADLLKYEKELQAKHDTPPPPTPVIPPPNPLIAALPAVPKIQPWPPPPPPAVKGGGANPSLLPIRSPSPKLAAFGASIL